MNMALANGATEKGDNMSWGQENILWTGWTCHPLTAIWYLFPTSKESPYFCLENFPGTWLQCSYSSLYPIPLNKDKFRSSKWPESVQWEQISAIIPGMLWLCILASWQTPATSATLSKTSLEQSRIRMRAGLRESQETEPNWVWNQRHQSLPSLHTFQFSE